MKVLMIFLGTLMSLLVSTFASAHTDHHLGDGSFHVMYHVVFWSIFAAIVYKGIRWFKGNKKLKNSSK